MTRNFDIIIKRVVFDTPTDVTSIVFEFIFSSKKKIIFSSDAHNSKS